MKRICHVSDIAQGEAKKFSFGENEDIAIFNLDGKYYAIDDKCTHGEASLADGYIDGDIVECPVHQGQFHIPTGEPRCFPVTVGVKTYRLEVRGGDIMLDTSSIERRTGRTVVPVSK